MRTRYLTSSFGILLVFLLLITSCSNATTITTSDHSSSSASNTPAVTSAGPTTITQAPANTSNQEAKPQGNLIAAFPDFGNENFLPWKSSMGASQISDLVYDMLIYYDDMNLKFIPGLAESWEVSADALTTTYHLRKGIQFQDGWGEVTAEDIKYNFEMQGSKLSVGKTSQARRIASMDIPDPYTLVVHMNGPYPTFFQEFSLGNGGVCQGIVSKKYVESVGEDAAGVKPIGTGPYKFVEGQIGSYYKLEAVDSHWRVVPEFKNLTIRLSNEISTTIAMLKNREVDLAIMVPAAQLPELKAAGVSTEVSPVGGGIIELGWGGLALPQDKRYDPEYHNKDPWTDVRVRKAMAMSIDRQAICTAIFAGGAEPAGVPLFSKDMEKYQYPYDPAAAKQLLADAGYPNGFTFRVMSYIYPGTSESPRIMEAVAGYWQQIGLDPKITIIDYNTYNTQRYKLRTVGDISIWRIAPVADMLNRVEQYYMPNSTVALFQDEGSYALFQEGNSKINSDERATYVDKLNQYYFDNVGPLPLIRNGNCFAWNSSTISPWPHASTSVPSYLEYVRHAQPLNTFRLFTPWPGTER